MWIGSKSRANHVLPLHCSQRAIWRGPGSNSVVNLDARKVKLRLTRYSDFLFQLAVLNKPISRALPILETISSQTLLASLKAWASKQSFKVDFKVPARLTEGSLSSGKANLDVASSTPKIATPYPGMTIAMLAKMSITDRRTAFVSCCGTVAPGS